MNWYLQYLLTGVSANSRQKVEEWANGGFCGTNAGMARSGVADLWVSPVLSGSGLLGGFVHAAVGRGAGRSVRHADRVRCGFVACPRVPVRISFGRHRRISADSGSQLDRAFADHRLAAWLSVCIVGRGAGRGQLFSRAVAFKRCFGRSGHAGGVGWRDRAKSSLARTGAI